MNMSKVCVKLFFFPSNRVTLSEVNLSKDLVECQR